MNKLEENVLVVPKTMFNPDQSWSEFTSTVNKHGFFLKREIAEINEDYLQIIPYVAINYTTTDKQFVFLYQRLKAGSEARLHDNYSIGIGGHIEESKDSRDYNEPRMSSFFRGMLRELKEEVDMGSSPLTANSVKPIDNKFLLYDNTNAVGRVHLGVLMTYSSDTLSVMPRETNKLRGQMSELSKIKDGSLPLENWTKEFLNRV